MNTLPSSRRNVMRALATEPTSGDVTSLLPTNIDYVAPPFQGIERDACMAEIRAALTEFRKRHGLLPRHLLSVAGRA